MAFIETVLCQNEENEKKQPAFETDTGGYMSNIFGFLSSEKQLPDNCRNDVTLAYFMRSPDFTRVIENRTTGTIRYQTENKIREIKTDDTAAVRTAKTFGISVEEGRHIAGLEVFLTELKSGTTIMFSSLQEFSSDDSAAVYLYRKMSSEGIRLQFLNEPWLNNEIYRSGLKEYVGLDGIIQKIIRATYDKPDAGFQYLEELSRSESNKSKKNELKR